MKHDQNFYDLHFLICTNEKALGESCGPKGAQKLVEELKPWIKEEMKRVGKPGKLRANKSGCLGRCGEGIACVAYGRSGGDWLTDVKPSDLDAIKAWLKAKIDQLG